MNNSVVTRKSYDDGDAILHSISIEGQILIERLGNEVIAKIPIKREGDRIIIDNEILGEFNPVVLTINDGFVSNKQGVRFYIVNPQEEATAYRSLMPIFDYDSCVRACKATHRTLGLPTIVDRICCFWYPT